MVDSTLAFGQATAAKKCGAEASYQFQFSYQGDTEVQADYNRVDKDMVLVNQVSIRKSREAPTAHCGYGTFDEG